MKSRQKFGSMWCSLYMHNLLHIHINREDENYTWIDVILLSPFVHAEFIK